MEKYGFIIIVFAVIIFLIYQSIIGKRNAIKNRINHIKKSWGKKNNREYTYNEYERIKVFFEKTKGLEAVDDITWNDLSMDDIFMDLNNTSSSVGEENLYKLLRDITFDEEELKKRDKIIDYFVNNPEEAGRLELIYAKIGRSKSISLYDFIHRLGEVREKSIVGHLLHPLLVLAAIILFAFEPTIGIVGIVAGICINVVAYYRYKADIENYFVCFKYLTAMVIGAKEIERLNISEIDEYNNKLRELYNELYPTFKGVSLLTTNAMGGSIGEVIMDYVRIILHVDIIAFYKMVAGVKKKQTSIDSLYECVGQLEAYYAIASYRVMLRESYGFYCKPLFVKERHIEGVTLYHPLINNPVSNSIDVKKGVLLTGSNASGKSTFLKTMAINCIFAQSIYTCTAEAFTMVTSSVMTSMALRDDLDNNESYYIVEIKSLKRILDKINDNKNVVCFVDEVLRGTNTVERIAASSEILKSMDRSNVICFAATHDIELTRILRREFDNYHFKEEVRDKDVIFDYVLNSGPATTRNAIKLLGIIGYNDEIINSAEHQAIKFLETGNW